MVRLSNSIQTQPALNLNSAMVSSSSTISLPLVLYLSFFSFFFSPSQSHNSNNKVSLALYYESLCPACTNFIINNLTKSLKDDDLLSFVDLNLVPWGNARLNAAGTDFTCQHGSDECLLNTVEACAINAWPEPSKHFPFIDCVEDLASQGKYNDWESCFQKLGLDSGPVENCYPGEIGKQLELKYGAETNALQPPHQYVPWVVVNGKALEEDYENFIKYVCEAYQGKVKPKSCTTAHPSTVVKAMPKHAVCEMEE